MDVYAAVTKTVPKPLEIVEMSDKIGFSPEMKQFTMRKASTLAFDLTGDASEYISILEPPKPVVVKSHSRLLVAALIAAAAGVALAHLREEDVHEALSSVKPAIDSAVSAVAPYISDIVDRVKQYTQ